MSGERERSSAAEEFRDAGYEAWIAAWRATALASREIETAMRDAANLSLTWGEVLARLDAADGGRLAMNQLARQVFLTRSGISQVVTAMSKQGLVERQSDAGNLRTTYAAITDQGRELLRNSASAFLSAIHENFGRHLEPDDARVIADALNRVIGILDGAPEPRAVPDLG